MSRENGLLEDGKRVYKSEDNGREKELKILKILNGFFRGMEIFIGRMKKNKSKIIIIIINK